MAIVEFKNVSRVYQSGDHTLRALDHLEMKLEEGKFVVILGPQRRRKKHSAQSARRLDSPDRRKNLCAGQRYFHTFR